MDAELKKLLDKEKVKYKLLPHRKVYTAFTSAETQHMDTKQLVKVVLAKLSKPSVHLLKHGGPAKLDFVFVAVPAGKRVNLKKVAKVINDHQEKSFKTLKKLHPKNLQVKKPSKISAKLASEKDIKKRLKTKVGLLHPFSHLFGLPILVDNKLAKNKKLIVSAGSYTESLEVSSKDFLKQMQGQLGNFTE